MATQLALTPTWPHAYINIYIYIYRFIKKNKDLTTIPTLPDQELYLAQLEHKFEAKWKTYQKEIYPGSSLAFT